MSQHYAAPSADEARASGLHTRLALERGGPAGGRGWR
jgi:hypothetical protein